MAISPKNCDISVKKAIQQLSRKTGMQGHPTFAGLTLLDLTASRLIWADTNKALASKDLVDLVAGTVNEINVTDDGSGGVIVGIVDPLIVTKGGTGVASLTDGGLLLGSGTGAVTVLAQATNGQLPIGSTGADPVLAGLTGTTDHISISNGAGSVTLDLDTNTQTLLGSFNGIFLEKLDFTISETGGTVTGSLEQDGGGDLIQKFSDGYTTLDCTPAKTIDLTPYVGTDAVPKLTFVYILQSNKTALVASNSDWPATEHNKIARLLLKSAVTTGTDGGALVNQNWNDYAFDATGEGHILDIEHRLRQEPAQYEDGLALTLKNSAGAALTTGNSSTAVELVTTEGRVFQLHLHTFPAFDMYSVGTDFAQIANQVVDEGGAYVTTADLVTDITRYVDGSDAGAAIGVNKYFNLVIWGVMNREGEASHIMINLPTGQYTTSANAVADIDGTSTFDIPFAFKGTGFLIARLTFRLIAGAQWTYIAQEDLRGQTPVVSAGVGISTTDHALLANLIAPADDHTQYLLASGTRALAGAWDMGSQALTNVNIDSGVITGITDLAVADGGTGQSTAQAAINALSAVSGATNEHVLTKDTGTGNAIWKVAAGGAGTWIALTDTDPANYTGEAGNAVVVNAGEDGLEFGAAPGSGAHTHDGDTLQLDGINSDGGAFAFTTTGDVTFDENVIISKHLALGGAAIDVNCGLFYEEVLTDTDNSAKKGINLNLQVAKTAAVMTTTAYSVSGTVSLDSTNTQNWTEGIAALRGLQGGITIEAGSSGTVTNAASVVASATIANAATVTNLYGFLVKTPTVAGSKVINEYGLYIKNQNTGATLNYAIYTNAGIVHFGDSVDPFGIGIASPAESSMLHIRRAVSGSANFDVNAVMFLENNDHATALIVTPNNKQGIWGFADEDDTFRAGLTYDHNTDKMWLYSNNGVRFTILADGGIVIANMKAGTTQGGAGAAANELWRDTDDGNTVKLGV